MRTFFTIGIAFVLLRSGSIQAQSQKIPLNADYYHLIDRLEIKKGEWSTSFHSTIKPYTRQAVVQLTDSILADSHVRLSPVDRFTLRYLRDDSWEWVPKTYPDSLPLLQLLTTELRGSQKQVGDSRRALGTFYKKKNDFYSYENADFDVHVSPVINFGYGAENNTGAEGASFNPYVNTRGLEIRGSIGKRLSFYTYLSDNQILYPRFIGEYGAQYTTNSELGFAPFEGFVKKIAAKRSAFPGADFLAARGYITFNALKIINVQFGHDRNFFGNGYRSLLLSDNSSPYLFLKISTQLGRFQYTNLLTEFQNSQIPPGTYEQLNPQKYAAIHHLSVNLGKHINLGVFEAEVFSRSQLELNYFNPVIFYRFIESYRGSADNALVGFDFKANFARHYMIYSQLMFDEFKFSELKAANGSWTNKYAIQAGFKYIDAFDIPNLDIQGEMNLARPYTYSHRSGQTNYVNYNQPLAHPLGANFIEGLAIVRYQPANRFTITGTFGLMSYGVDPPNRNYGGNLLQNYESRIEWPDQPLGAGHHIGQGRKTLVSYGDVRVSYMLKHNLFIDFQQIVRKSDSQLERLKYNTSSASFALRWNLPYRTLVL
ncbi:hypothetical protein EHT25_27555 [Larkinella rosea]|uniref:Capsule assembly Wzi family protein n=1 Tax=Larkinella rosea TaxID=2025312 RepID=A0A3P1BD94_9BACT|nr:hypothetical protein EHT25_27555 [Larkinella rosea]